MRTRLIALLLLCTAGSPAAADTSSDDLARRRIRVKVVNASPHVIREVYICPSSQATWGENLLVRGPLRPGGRAVFRFAGECGVYDLRLVAEKDTEYLEEELEFCEDDDVVTVGGGALKRVKPGRP